MTADLFPWPWADKRALAEQAEMFETQEWAVEAILDAELLTPTVIDPCCGRGVLALAATGRGYRTVAFDLHDWGYGTTGIDFLAWSDIASDGPWFPIGNATVLMNPPFSKAVDFVRHAMSLGVRKIVSFQRFAWWESETRTGFWAEHPPSRVYICRNRADCWRIDISPAERKGRSSSTPHAWFVWERGHPHGPLLGHIGRAKR